MTAALSAGTLRRRRAEAAGRAAEEHAAHFLEAAGYTIEARRFRSPDGELDLVARHGDVLALIEVKARESLAAGLEAVSPRAQRRLTAAALHFLAARPDLAMLSLRFDVIVTLGSACRHLPAAFEPSAEHGSL